jgi:hypothetical protein
MAKRFRTLRVRQFLLDHVEKLGLGVAGVVVLAAVIGTNWVPYPKQPSELLATVTEAQSRLENAPWPAEEQARFVLGTLPEAAVTALLETPVPVWEFAHSQPPRKHLLDIHRPLRMPQLRPVEDLIASSEHVLIRRLPERPRGDGGRPSTPANEESEPEVVRDEFLGLDRRGPGGPQAVTGTDVAAGADQYDPAIDYPYAVGNGSVQHDVQSGRGYAYAAVRGVFDLRELEREISEAARVSGAEARRRMVIIDFELERQKLLRQPDRWGDWTAVDPQVFRDVAMSAAGFEPDVVSAQVIDGAITAPLLSRITGVWRTQATHPRLASFELSSQALERETAYLKALVERARQESKRLGSQRVRKGGFAGLLQDARELELQLLGADRGTLTPSGRPAYGPAMPAFHGGQPTGNSGSTLEQLIRDVARELDPKEQDRQLKDWVRRRATADGELLFRYFDFDVGPGATYRYRVRLVLRNPNYGRSLAAAGGQPEVVRTETLLTPWSATTPPVRVVDNVRYFLAGLQSGPARRTPLARLSVFQYDLDLGTTVQREIDVPVGQQIAGRARTDQFDPARGTVEVKDYLFRSDDVLIDALGDLLFTPADHPDLVLGPHSRGRAQIAETALVAGPDRELRTLDRESQAEDLATAERHLILQAEQAERMMRRAPLAGETTGGLEELYEQMYGPPAAAGRGPQRPRGNVMQRRGAR